MFLNFFQSYVDDLLLKHCLDELKIQKKRDAFPTHSRLIPDALQPFRSIPKPLALSLSRLIHPIPHISTASPPHSHRIPTAFPPYSRRIPDAFPMNSQRIPDTSRRIPDAFPTHPDAFPTHCRRIPDLFPHQLGQRSVRAQTHASWVSCWVRHICTLANVPSPRATHAK